MSTEFYALKYNKTRQVKITNDEENNYERLRLYVNGAPYSVNAKAGSYVGCGIDAAHSFMGYFVNAIPRSRIKKYVKVTSGPSDFRKYANKLLLGGIIFNPGDDYFTTPAQLAVGLDKLTKKNLTSRKDIENDTIRHNKGTNSSIIQKVRHHLRRAIPVVALISKGNHWVTIVGMDCKYKTNGDIDVEKTCVWYLDLTSGEDCYAKFIDLKILGWSSFWGRQYASSYVSGTVISLKSDSVLYADKWSKGWNSKIYEVKGKQYLFLLKPSNGLVHIHNIKADGSIGRNIQTYDWTKGWSNINFYTVKGKTYLFLMKAGKGDGYTNGLVHINKVNDNGTIDKVIEKHDWRSGWNKIEFFYFKNKTYVILNRDDGTVHIRVMNSNGTLGEKVIEEANFLKNSKSIVGTDIQVIETENAVYIYGINNTGKRTIYSQCKFYLKNKKFNFEQIDTQDWSTGWVRMNIFKASEKKSYLIISKGVSRNGIMHIHKINNLKNDAKIGKLIDDNYFRNKFVMGLVPMEQWSNIQYFKARNTKLKLFLLDKYSGRVRVINMKNNGAFENDLVPSKELKYYNIEINTSNEKNAGTSAKVFITLKGDNWESPEYHIDTISDDFERGSRTIQNIPVDKYFGEIKKVMIRHDNSKSKPGWHLQSIYITEGNSKNKWSARVYKWFAKTVGDKKIQREITLEKMPKKN
ncbi:MULTISPECIES: PLAT/LH2 domain-containing protein [Arcobacteraceae]|uniref:PLAT domain-containing protein n=1 Tax=Poseidonibacter parvus TaxID=1850254 RepID=A0A1P8KKD9_9BACT|nr:MULTISPECIES: PLAT/LH2 domain-containing protein [Arcobacteraceae]APW64976.1 hypothetical protein LPB137_03570 [Poseidonibacter parvus]